MQTGVMAVMTPLPDNLLRAFALFAALVALLKWKLRRLRAERRINRGLRAYTTGQTVS
jgi:hypothetical protein